MLLHNKIIKNYFDHDTHLSSNIISLDSLNDKNHHLIMTLMQALEG